MTARTATTASAAPDARRPARRMRCLERVSIVPAVPGPMGRLGCVPVEHDAAGVALVGVTGGAVEHDREAVAVLRAAREGAERGHLVTRGAHVGDRAAVL